VSKRQRQVAEQNNDIQIQNAVDLNTINDNKLDVGSDTIKQSTSKGDLQSNTYQRKTISLGRMGD
jgi:hypothetical protein